MELLILQEIFCLTLKEKEIAANVYKTYDK